MAPDRITLRNMAFYAYHGVRPSEMEQGQRFFVDVDLFMDLRPAGETDDIRLTADYQGVFETVKEHVEGKRFHLLEALVESVAQAILDRFKSVERVNIRVRKPSTPLQGILDHIEVEVSRER